MTTITINQRNFLEPELRKWPKGLGRNRTMDYNKTSGVIATTFSDFYLRLSPVGVELTKAAICVSEDEHGKKYLEIFTDDGKGNGSHILTVEL